jgi:hypothetical protein
MGLGALIKGLAALGIPARLDGEAAARAAADALLIPLAQKGAANGVLMLDAYSNALANVSHRTGLLASLLTLAGGVGEVGVATDKQALVVYNGVPGGAIAHYRGRQTAYAECGPALANAVPAATLTQLMLTIGNDVTSRIDNTNNWVIPPYPGVSHTIEIAGALGCGVDTSGTARELFIQYATDATMLTWALVPRCYFQWRPPVLGVDASGVNYPFNTARHSITAWGYRLMVKHDATAAINMGGPVAFKFISST